LLDHDTVKRFSSGALSTVYHLHQHIPKFPPIPASFCNTSPYPNPAEDRFRCCLGHQLFNPSVAVAPRSGPASLRTAADSDVLPQAAASNSGHASPAAPRSSPVAVASSSATNSRSSAAVPVAATDSPSCKPTGSMPAGLGSSGTDGKRAASSSPPACLP
jgi:hypothetical protein